MNLKELARQKITIIAALELGKRRRNEDAQDLVKLLLVKLLMKFCIPF
jgi:hypothetical protein